MSQIPRDQNQLLFTIAVQLQCYDVRTLEDQELAINDVLVRFPIEGVSIRNHHSRMLFHVLNIIMLDLG